MLNRYMSNSSVDYSKVIVSVLRYLSYTHNYWLNYPKYLVVHEGYNDVNRIFDINNLQSTSGYAFTLVGVTISWKISKRTMKV